MGKRSYKEPLKGDYSGSDMIEIPAKEKSKPNPFQKTTEQILNTPGLILEVPKILTSPHKLIREAKTSSFI